MENKNAFAIADGCILFIPDNGKAAKLLLEYCAQSKYYINPFTHLKHGNDGYFRLIVNKWSESEINTCINYINNNL